MFLIHACSQNQEIELFYYFANLMFQVFAAINLQFEFDYFEHQ